MNTLEYIDTYLELLRMLKAKFSLEGAKDVIRAIEPHVYSASSHRPSKLLADILDTGTSLDELLRMIERDWDGTQE